MKKVSVIIPAYNCENYLSHTVHSVMEQETELEIILVDDASTDKTEELIQKLKKEENYPIRYLRNSFHSGVSASRNRGVKEAQGDYIAYLDADDWWEKGKLEKQLKKLEASGGILCYTGRELYREDGAAMGKKIAVPQTVDFYKLLHTNYIPCSSVLVKTEVAREFPMEHDEVHEDYLTWLRIVKKYGCAYGINEPLLKTRLTRKGKSRNKIKTVAMTYGVYRLLGLRKRKSIWYTANHLLRSFFRYQMANF